MDAEARFDAATQWVAVAASSGSWSGAQSALLDLYGLFKQATCGDCNVPKPWFFEASARAKWSAWRSRRGLSRTQAQRQYTERLDALAPSWASATTGTSTAKRGGAGGPVQSRMAQGTEHDGEDDDSTPALHQAAGAGDVATVEQLLRSGASIDQSGTDGETALHWAADRGHAEVVQFLLSSGANVDAVDNDGLTPLFYAAIAEQYAVGKLLVGSRACLDVRDFEGKTVADVAPKSWSFVRASATVH